LKEKKSRKCKLKKQTGSNCECKNTTIPTKNEIRAEPRTVETREREKLKRVKEKWLR
jgi:hypothetical protein